MGGRWSIADKLWGELVKDRLRKERMGWVRTNPHKGANGVSRVRREKGENETKGGESSKRLGGKRGPEGRGNIKEWALKK